MKKLIINMACLLVLNSASAADIATMQMKMSGDIKNTYYLCVSNAGCVNLAAAMKGKLFPINPGSINSIVITNATTVRMYPQQLPASCRVSVNNNQALIVSGKIMKPTHNKIYISNLHCAVS